MSIGLRIKQLQKELGFKSADKFAEQLTNTTASRINDIVRGKQRLPEDLMIELITKFNVNANWLLTGTGEIFIGIVPIKTLTKEENELLENFRESNEQGKYAIRTTASALACKEALKNSSLAA